MRTAIMRTIRGLALAVAALAVALGAGAAEPEKPPPGQAKYLIVLWDAGTPVPGRPGERMKKVPEPDVEKLGGRTLAKQANRRVVFLPVAVARQLRKHQAVSYVQRIWTGEPISEWDESETAGASLRTGKVAADADPTLSWERGYGYDGDGNITSIGNDQFDYDGMGRLGGAVVDGVAQGYVYDGFGNLTAIATSAGTVSIPTDPTTNRMMGQTYDAAGNVTSRKDRGTYVYDSLNMVVEYSAQHTSPWRILYDASDERIGTIVEASLQQWTIRDFDGQVLREFRGYDNGLNLVWSWEQDHVRGGGQLIGGESVGWSFYYEEASAFTYGGKRHYHLDHLGSVRVVTDQAGRAIAENDFYPFGTARTKQYQEQINWGQPHADGMRFAGHWRDFMGHPDVEGDDYLDYMHARYYDPNLGRFLSVDPGRDWDPRQPQSWNMYAYVRNNPIKTIDPTGKCGWSDFKSWIRDTRADISNWWSEKWHKDIPTPADQYGGVEAIEEAGLSPADAQQMGNPQANWANARAEAGAILSDQATEAGPTAPRRLIAPWTGMWSACVRSSSTSLTTI